MQQNTASKTKAGKGLKHTFNLREVYFEKYLPAAERAARKVGEAMGLDAKKLEEGVKLAVEQAEIQHIDEFLEEFPGDFTVHRPSIGETIEIDNRIAVLTRQIPEEAQRVRGGNLAVMAATLEKVVDDAPEWYKDAGGPLGLYNYDVIALAHFAWRDFVDSFRL